MDMTVEVPELPELTFDEASHIYRLNGDIIPSVSKLMEPLKDQCYLELDVVPADRARADMATDAFYALWDAIRKVSDDLDRLAGDCRVVDAIYAVNDVRRRVGTLKTED